MGKISQIDEFILIFLAQIKLKKFHKEGVINQMCLCGRMVLFFDLSEKNEGLDEILVNLMMFLINGFQLFVCHQLKFVLVKLKSLFFTVLGAELDDSSSILN